MPAAGRLTNGQIILMHDQYSTTLQAMQDGLKGDTTTYVGPPSGDFFRFFGNELGKSAPAQ